MSTDAYYHLRDMQIDLAHIDSRLYDEIVSLRGHIDSPPAPPVFTCLGNDGPMYVYLHLNGRYFLRHYPGNTCGRSHYIAATMSDEHRRQADYCQRAADDNGLDAKLEMATGNGTRLDVAVFGDVNNGFEIQRSTLSRARAKTRAAKSFDAGWPTAWVHDKPDDPDWAGHVPTARLTVRDWDGMPARNTAKVIIADFVRERESNHWRYVRRPHAILLDDLVYQMSVGAVVPVAVGKMGRVDLATKASCEVIDSVTYPGASQWHPTILTPQNRTASQRITKKCPTHPTPKNTGPTVLAYDQEIVRRGGKVACRICGLDINTVFGIMAHYDCAAREEIDA